MVQLRNVRTMLVENLSFFTKSLVPMLHKLKGLETNRFSPFVRCTDLCTEKRRALFQLLFLILKLSNNLWIVEEICDFITYHGGERTVSFLINLFHWLRFEETQCYESMVELLLSGWPSGSDARLKIEYVNKHFQY